MTDDWMQLADLSDHDDWTPPTRRTFPPRQPTPQLLQYRIVSADLPGGSLELQAAHLRLSGSGTLLVFDGAGKPCAGFAPGKWSCWQLIEATPDDDVAEIN